MTDGRLSIEVSTGNPGETHLAMRGDIDVAADEALVAAYASAAASGSTRLVLDFTDVDYINSTGIALIVRLLAEARRDHREVVAVGLSDHYKEIFRITRLSDYLVIADTPSAAADAAGAGDLQEAPREHHRRRRAPRRARPSSASTATSPAPASPCSWTPTARRRAGTRSIVLDFSDLEYMNSGGIGLLVTLLVRAQRGGQGLHAIGLTDHYRQILALTRLDEAIGIHDDEGAALAAASA